MKWFRRTIFNKNLKKGKNYHHKVIVDNEKMVSENINFKYHLLKQLVINEFHGQPHFSTEEMKSILNEFIEKLNFPNLTIMKLECETPSASIKLLVEEDNKKYQIDFSISGGTRNIPNGVQNIHFVKDYHFVLLVDVIDEANKIIDYMEKQFDFYVNKLLKNPNAHISKNEYDRYKNVKIEPLKDYNEKYHDYLEIEFDKYISTYKTSTDEVFQKVHLLYRKLLAVKLLSEQLTCKIMNADDLEYFLQDESMCDMFVYDTEEESEPIDDDFDEDEDYYQEEVFYNWNVWSVI